MSRRYALSALLLVACGARSGLELDRPDGGPDAQSVVCLRDWECDDGIECTLDRCTGGLCVAQPEHARCEDGIFCNGPPRCVAGAGCVSEPPSCGDGVACTVDGCDESLSMCTHQADADLCPVSHRCDPGRGCIARALVHDTERLWEVDLPSGDARGLASTEVGLTDLALHPDGRLFGVNHGALFELDEETGRARWITDVSDSLNALEVGPDGSLYGAGTSSIVRLDPASGAVETVAVFPRGWSASGDVAFVSGRLLVTGTSTPYTLTEPDSLFDATDGGEAVNVGSIGVICVWGLAPFGETLYGLTCNGELIRIDAATGRGTVLRAELGIEVGGAAAR
jgi:hypothetical protein